MDSGSFGKICYATGLRPFLVIEASLGRNVAGENNDQTLNYPGKACGGLGPSHQKW
ncbi:MAG: hypothetical protein JWP89_4809 [Schlesneria sp.]|nr:hypothetical protein [Schlesneria sp.]